MWLTTKRASSNIINTLAATTLFAIAGLGTATAADITATIEGNSAVYGLYDVTVAPGDGNTAVGSTSSYHINFDAFLVDPDTNNVVAEVTSLDDQFSLDTNSSLDSNIGSPCPNPSECILGSLGDFVDLTPMITVENGGQGICCGDQGLTGGANYVAIREDTAPAPEPATLPLTLLALGSAAIPVWRRRRARSAA